MPETPAQIALNTTPQNTTPSRPVPSRHEVWRMFDRIAGRYDTLNRLLSGRRDVAWRRRMAQNLPDGMGLHVLDLATGTADVLLTLCRQPGKIRQGIGMDMSANMLDIGRQKIREGARDGAIAMVRGDAVHVAVKDGCFDAVTIAFGIRNVMDVDAALREIHRVLRTGGRALVLEFSLPANAVFRAMYLLYFRHILPRIGAMISGDAYAYRYLNSTVESFPYGQAFCDLMVNTGFHHVHMQPLTGGIATLYTGEK